MKDLNALRQQARQAIDAGMMPSRRPNRMWGGPGNGGGCAICQAPVQHDELGYELEFSPLGGEDGREYALHPRCYEAWDVERRHLEHIKQGSRDHGASQPLSALARDAGANTASGQILQTAKVEGTISCLHDDAISASESHTAYRREPS